MEMEIEMFRDVILCCCNSIVIRRVKILLILFGDVVINQIIHVFKNSG